MKRSPGVDCKTVRRYVDAAVDAPTRPDDEFGLITSFETVEHVAKPDEMVRELGRVLRPDGTLVLSTPHATFTEPVDGRPRNPYHLRKYLPDELRALLERHFASVSLLGQRPAPAARPSPYWERPELLPRGLGGKAQVLTWKAVARLPPPARDRFAHWFLRRRLHPGEHDFTFEPADVERGHVVVAVCTGPR